MNAVILRGIGGLEQLEYATIKTPKPKQDEVLVKIIYCGINHLDLHIREGKRPGPRTFPHILGSEIVGIVEKLGTEDGEFSVGETVSIYSWTFCGKCQQCKNDNEQICDNGGTIGRTQWGGYAEYVSVPVKNLIKIPKGVSLEDACAVTLTGITALHLIERAAIPNKKTVLVTGATGGVGSIVIQLLKHKKCTVIAATSHSEKRTYLEKLGADVVDANNLVKDVFKAIPGGVEYAVDIVGGKIWSDAVSVLAKNGKLVFCATSRDEQGVVDITSAFARQVNILGAYGGNRKHLKQVLSLLAKGTITPIISDVLPLEKIPQAHARIENQKIFGKLLIKP